MEYNELVQKNQDGFIGDLEFLLAQEDLAQEYQQDMKTTHQAITNETAREWLLQYENKHLYNNG